MKIEMWDIDRPIPYDRNPRNITREAIDAVKESLSRHGWQQPGVVNKDGVLIIGHTRQIAAKELGLKKMPIIVSNLSKADEDDLRVRDNKSGEYSEWDIEQLAVDWGLEELEGFGFEEKELSSQFDYEDKTGTGTGTGGTEGGDNETPPAKPPEPPPFSRIVVTVRTGDREDATGKIFEVLEGFDGLEIAMEKTD